MGKRRSGTPPPVANLVVVSDTHCGCKLALCPPEGAELDDGGVYMPSAFQLGIWQWWEEFFDVFVPEATRGEPYALIVNGDAVEGNHHRATTPISANLEDQSEIAYRALAPQVARASGGYFHIRGTEAHVGSSGVEEERLAKRLGAIPNAEGQYARYDLWKRIGDAGKVVHLLHHIGTTGSQAYEATAVHKELTESYLEAARWGRRAPDIIVRSHRHRNIETRIPIRGGSAHAVVTPCWQGKTPFAWKIPGARLAMPQFGGIVIRWAHGELFVRSFVRSPEPPEPE